MILNLNNVKLRLDDGVWMRIASLSMLINTTTPVRKTKQYHLQLRLLILGEFAMFACWH